jgi:hypothetical protein
MSPGILTKEDANLALPKGTSPGGFLTQPPDRQIQRKKDRTMNSTSSVFQLVWEPFCEILLVSCGVIGLIALLSPKAFQRIAKFSGYWIDSNRILAWLDKPIDVDLLVLPHSRKFGVAVLAAVTILALHWFNPSGPDLSVARPMNLKAASRL